MISISELSIHHHISSTSSSFVHHTGLISGSLRTKLKDIWFTLYTRGSHKVSSSGFEHVFVGELKDGKVSGFHNWISYMKQEKSDLLDYKGYIRVLNLNGKVSGVIVTL